MQERVKQVLRVAIPYLLVIGGVIGFWYGLRFALHTAYPLMVVESESMHPTLERGDLIVVQGVDPYEIQRGDVIVYRWRLHGREELIIHRVVEINYTEDGTPRFFTKGDNNPRPDPWIYPEGIPPERVIARWTGVRIPYLGYLSLWLRGPTAYLLIAVIVVIAIVWEIFEEMKKRRKETLEEAPAEEQTSTMEGEGAAETRVYT